MDDLAQQQSQDSHTYLLALDSGYVDCRSGPTKINGKMNMRIFSLCCEPESLPLLPLWIEVSTTPTANNDSILQSFQCLRSAKSHNPLLPKNPPQKQSNQPKPYCKYQVSAIFLGSVQMEVNKLPAAQEKKGNSPDRTIMTALLNESLQLVRETSFSSRIHTLLTHTDKEISSRCPNYFCNRREYLHHCWKNPKYRKRAEDKTTYSDSDLSQF